MTPTPKRTRSWIEVAKDLRKSGLSGDVGAAALGALLTALPLYLYGPGDVIWGVPAWVLFAGLAGVGVGFCSMATLRDD